MKVFLIIWITILFFPVCLISQGDIRTHPEIDENYRQYRIIFDHEIKAMETPMAEEEMAIPAGISAVPAWLIQPLASLPAHLQVIGISDPGLDSSLARTQALYRALLLASLMNGSSMNNLIDLYSQDYNIPSPQFSGQYFDYFEFTSVVNCEISDVSVLKEHFTGFGECIVLVDYRVISSTSPEYIFKTVGMINEFEKDGIYECNSRIESGGQSEKSYQKDDFKYICRSVNDLVEVESYYQDKLLPVFTSKLKYRVQDTVNFTPTSSGVKTDHGLWNALLISIIKSLTLEIRSQSAQVKSATDHYPGKTQALNREAVTGILSFHLDRIYLHDNSLWAIPEQINFSQP